MDIATVRQEFEDKVFSFYATANQAGAYATTDGKGDDTRESLLWRQDNGRYGVRDIESAWVGFLWGRGLS